MAQTVSLPTINAPLIAALPTAAVAEKVTTFIGQMLGTGTATKDVLVDVAVGTENTLFGEGSMLATMIAEFRAVNEVSTVQAVPKDDADLVAGAAAEWEITFVGAVAKTGTITIQIGNNANIYTAAVTLADTETAIAAAVAAAITTTFIPGGLVANATSALGVVTLVARNEGAEGNSIGIKLDVSDTGTVGTIASSVTGAGTYTLTGIDTVLGERTDVVAPYSYDFTSATGAARLGVVLTMLDDRFNYNNKIMDGRLITATTNTAATIVTAMDLENSQSLVVFADKLVAKATSKMGSAIFVMPYQKASRFAGIRALRTDDGSLITNYVTTLAPSDQRGGTHTNSLPFMNTPMEFSIIPIGEGFTVSEVASLSDAGATVMGNNTARTEVITGEVYTTYKTDPAGNADTTYEFLNYVDTSTASREYIFNALKIDYAQKRLTQGQGVAGYAFASEGEVRANMISYYLTLTGAGYVLLQAGVMSNGASIVDLFKSYLTVVINTATGNIDITSILPIVTQTRSIYCPLSIVFNPESI